MDLLYLLKHALMLSSVYLVKWLLLVPFVHFGSFTYMNEHCLDCFDECRCFLINGPFIRNYSLCSYL